MNGAQDVLAEVDARRPGDALRGQVVPPARRRYSINAYLDVVVAVAGLTVADEARERSSVVQDPVVVPGWAWGTCE